MEIFPVCRYNSLSTASRPLSRRLTGSPSSSVQVLPAAHSISMSDLHHECGIAAIYHLPGEEQSALPRRGPGRNLAADAADAARHAEPRQLAAGMTTYNPDARPAARHAQGSRHGQRGVPPQPPRQVREHHAGVRRPGGDRPRPLRHLRRRRPQLRPAVRAARTCEKRKWFAFAFNGQLANYPGAARQAAERGRLSSDARHRHRNHHARAQPRAVGRPPAATGRGDAQRSASGSTAPTTSCF